MMVEKTEKNREKIRRIIENLSSPVIIQGEPAVRWNLEERMAYYRVPGVSIALIDGNQIEWTAGFGRLENGFDEWVTETSLFQAASISKPVTALAAMMLVQDGKLDLDEDINTYLRSCKIPENHLAQRSKVTLRKILNHTAGLNISGFSGYLKNEAMPDLLQSLIGLAPSRNEPVRVLDEPGRLFRYSGGGYGILELVLTEITGCPFAELMHDMVFEPLGMDRSTFKQPDAAGGFTSIARGHTVDGDVIPGGWEVDPVLAPAGLWTTPPDLAAFGLEMAGLFEGKPGGLISYELASLMVGDGVETGLGGIVRYMGLGFFISALGRQGFFSHTGSNAGYRCMLLLAKDGSQGAVIMTNGDSGNLLYAELLQSIYREYHWTGLEPMIKTQIELDAIKLEAFVGEYRSGSEVITITMKDGHLVLKESRSIELVLVPETGARFFTTAATEPIQFLFDEKTRVVIENTVFEKID